MIFFGSSHHHPGSNVHRHELLEQEFSSIRQLDLRYLRLVFAALTLEDVLPQVGNGNQSAQVADVYPVGVGHFEQPFTQKLCSSVGYLTIWKMWERMTSSAISPWWIRKVASVAWIYYYATTILLIKIDPTVSDIQFKSHMLAKGCAWHFQAYIGPQVPSKYVPRWLGKIVWRKYFSPTCAGDTLFTNMGVVWFSTIYKAVTQDDAYILTAFWSWNPSSLTCSDASSTCW